MMLAHAVGRLYVSVKEAYSTAKIQVCAIVCCRAITGPIRHTIALLFVLS
jgi:hypothetical protein